jgi:hypothetical protein
MTDETAKAIVEHDAPESIVLVGLPLMWGDVAGIPADDLKAMARLWLKLPDILDRLQKSAEMLVDVACCNDTDLTNSRAVSARVRMTFARDAQEYASFGVSDNESLYLQLEELRDTGNIIPKSTPFEILFGPEPVDTITETSQDNV